MVFSLFIALAGVFAVLIAVFSDAIFWKRGGLLLSGLSCVIIGIYDYIQIHKIVKLISQIELLERGAQEAGANQTTFNS